MKWIVEHDDRQLVVEVRTQKAGKGTFFLAFVPGFSSKPRIAPSLAIVEVLAQIGIDRGFRFRRATPVEYFQEMGK